MTALQAAQDRLRDYVDHVPTIDPLRLKSLMDEIALAARSSVDPF